MGVLKKLSNRGVLIGILSIFCKPKMIVKVYAHMSDVVIELSEFLLPRTSANKVKPG